jgi:hypothetical protein
MSSIQKITRAQCKNCGDLRNHGVIAVDEQGDKEKEHISYCYNLYEMLKCLGCNKVILKHTYYSYINQNPTIVYYLPSSMWRAPSWVIFSLDVPASICALMREVYTALENGSLRLAVMGIRAALENLMIEKVGDQQSFKANIDALQKAGYLSLRQAVGLDSILEAGHAAVHRQWEPTPGDIYAVLETANTLIESVYLHEDRVRYLDKNAPKRPRPNRTPVSPGS